MTLYALFFLSGFATCWLFRRKLESWFMHLRADPVATLEAEAVKIRAQIGRWKGS